MGDFGAGEQTRTEPVRAGGNAPEFTVSELSQRLRRTVEDAFGHVRVRGEIAGFKRAASGHAYFRLKDAEAVIDAVCWKGTMARLAVRPEDGIEIVCVGKLTTYPGRSSYQIVVERMELAGIGALMALLEQRKKKLAAEGLFDAARKRPRPWLPNVIGVVTSPTGAVIRDILHRLRERFPRRVLVWPVLVQGEGAAEQVAAAINGFNSLPPDGAVPRPDLLIVARGGGSLEDLMAFNEEIVVRAAAASGIPLISAVGHETDTTLIDFASDLRAPTPTAAAELAVPVRVDLANRLAEQDRRLNRAEKRLVVEKRTQLDGLKRGLRNPREILEQQAQRLDDLGERLPRALTGHISRSRAELMALAGALRPAVLRRELRDLRAHLERSATLLERGGRRRLGDARTALHAQSKLLESLSYRSVLARGYAVVRNEAGAPLMRAADAQMGQHIEIEFSDGRLSALLGSEDAPKPASRPRKATDRNPSDGGPDQGRLL